MKQTLLQLSIKKDIGNYCKSYRVNELGLTLVEFSDKVNAKFKSVSSFENGRSSSMFYLFMYMTLIQDSGARLGFLQGINGLIDMNVAMKDDTRGVHHG